MKTFSSNKKNRFINIISAALFMTVLLFSSFLSAAEFSVRGDYNSESKSLSPYYSLNWFWNSTFSSGLDAKYSKDIVLSKIDGFSQSNDATEIKIWDFRANVLSYNFTWDRLLVSIGGTGSYKYIKKGEFGYFKISAVDDPYWASTPQDSTWVVFDNDVEIKALMPIITAGIKYKNSWFNAVFRGDVFPSYYLKVKQDTEFDPIIPQHGLSNESKWQKAGYAMCIDLAFNTSPFIFVDLVLRGEFDYIRTDYSLDLLGYNNSNDTFFFNKGNVDVSEMNNSFIIAASFSNPIFGEISPLIGFGKNQVINRDHKKDKSETENQWIMTFGMVSRIDFAD